MKRVTQKSQVQLEKISFNHDHAKPGGSIAISQGGKIVTPPEWQREKDDEQNFVAYAFQQQKEAITIIVELSCPEKNLKQVEVKAIADGKNVLGNVQQRTVTFDANGKAEKVPFTVPTPRFAETGVNEDLGSWEWQYQVEPGGAWFTITTTKHQIYVLLDAPVEPWEKEPPWVEVLDKACKWARGERNWEGVASRIAEEVHDLGEEPDRLVYYDRNASYAFDTFDCAGFLKLLKNGTNSPRAINCYDCASIVVTFANILGASLYEVPIFPGIQTHYIKLIGVSRWARDGFSYHAVAWNLENSVIFDAFLQVDTDGNPLDHNKFTATVPTNLPFEGKGNYKFCLYLGGFGEPHLEDKVRRPIGKRGFPGQKKVTDKIALDFLRSIYKFETWPAEESGNKFKSDVVRILVESLPELPAFHSWRFEDKEVLEQEDVVAIRFFLTRNEAPTRNLVEVNLYVVPGTANSNDFFLQLLAQFHKSDLKRDSVNTLGRLTFVVPCELGVVFVRRNLAVFVRSVGKEKCEVFELAKALDDFFASNIAEWKEDRING